MYNHQSAPNLNTFFQKHIDIVTGWRHGRPPMADKESAKEQKKRTSTKKVHKDENERAHYLNVPYCLMGDAFHFIVNMNVYLYIVDVSSSSANTMSYVSELCDGCGMSVVIGSHRTAAYFPVWFFNLSNFFVSHPSHRFDGVDAFAELVHLAAQ